MVVCEPTLDHEIIFAEISTKCPREPSTRTWRVTESKWPRSDFVITCESKSTVRGAGELRGRKLSEVVTLAIFGRVETRRIRIPGTNHRRSRFAIDTSRIHRSLSGNSSVIERNNPLVDDRAQRLRIERNCVIYGSRLIAGCSRVNCVARRIGVNRTHRASKAARASDSMLIQDR